MKTAIITIAGLSSRFNQGISPADHELKAIYYEERTEDTLLFHMLKKLDAADEIIIVAGYKYEDLCSYIDDVLPPEMRERITVVCNDHYEDWSSGYSLYIGINEALKHEPDSIIFVEGDLDVDDETFRMIDDTEMSVVTCNHDIIKSNKAVIGYCDSADRYKYAFSTSHGLVSIDEPFGMIFNSGQIWKFTNMILLKEANAKFEQVKETGTNLTIVSEYFGQEDSNNIEVIDFKRWTNCNTREDYKMILKEWETER